MGLTGARPERSGVKRDPAPRTTWLHSPSAAVHFHWPAAALTHQLDMSQLMSQRPLTLSTLCFQEVLASMRHTGTTNVLVSSRARLMPLPPPP